MSAMGASMSLQLFVESDTTAEPQMGKLQRNGTVSSAVSTTAGSSSASRTSSECSSDVEDFPALPTLIARPRAGSNQKPKSSIWFSAETAEKVLKPAAAPPRRAEQEEVVITEPEPTIPQTKLADLNFEYPVDMVVRNTFLDFEGHCSEAAPVMQRRARSAEPSRRFGARADCVESEFFRRFDGLPVAAVEAADQSCEGTESSPPEGPKILELVSALPLPALGSMECPTVGSAPHAIGQCKPCAFFWKPRGCGNGVECPFCHLCDANEKKRRQKEKKASFQVATSFPSRMEW